MGNNLDYCLWKYKPTRQQAIEDFDHITHKLLHNNYHEIDNIKDCDSLEDWDDDYMLMVKTYYYCLHENFDEQQRNELWQTALKVLKKRKEYMR